MYPPQGVQRKNNPYDNHIRYNDEIWRIIPGQSPDSIVDSVEAWVEDNIVPEVVLFDLDETLINRTQSIQRYAERFQRDFHHVLVATSVVMIADAIIAADERG
jgi:hypothetical protein